MASPIEVYDRRRGVQAARRVAGRNRGRAFDPTLTDLFDGPADDILAGLDDASDWEAILDAEPPLARTVTGAELDKVLLARADLIDMASVTRAEHSRGAANLVSEAARLAGHDADEATTFKSHFGFDAFYYEPGVEGS